MKDLKEELERKRAQLEELKKSRPKATCVGINSSPSAVSHELMVEELEEEISDIEKKLMIEQ